jgi:UDP-N-acetylmuramoyl-tripeptide--D-alanyl-D-alanine ligase
VTAAGLILAALGLLVLLAGRLHLMLHLFQLEHYEAARLNVWVRRRGERIEREALAAIALGGLALTVLAAIDAGAGVLAAGLVFTGFAAATGVRQIRRPQTKPLVFTPRARRLFALALAIPALVLAALALAAALGMPAWVAAAAGAVAGVTAHLAAPELLALADRLLRPVQSLDNRRFVRRAQRRLAQVHPLVVGITGSFGKTTTKAAVTAVGELRSPTYPTPASYNSLLGVVRATNEGLGEHHRIYVVEMGAYRRGDVAELCDLVHPSIGVLTAIGPAHLERFGSLDEIEKAKGELAECLPEDGTFVTTADDERCRRAAERARCPVRLFSVAGSPDAEVFGADVRMEAGTTRFRLCRRLPSGEVEEAQVRSKLLGRHNVANLLAAAAVGVELDLPVPVIARGLGKVEPPAHRLAPIVNKAAGVVVIDDAYNSNPVGAAAALEVLADHKAERRLLVTPGMVELGEREAAENRRFGTQAAEVCDLVVLVGREQSRPILEGLEDASFPAERIHVVDDAREAEALLARTTRPGDVVLFENDLPDLYLGREGSRALSAT